MSMGDTWADPRTHVRSAAAVVSFAIAATIQHVLPEFPETLLAAWMAAFMALVGLAESMFDNRTRSVIVPVEATEEPAVVVEAEEPPDP